MDIIQRRFDELAEAAEVVRRSKDTVQVLKPKQVYDIGSSPYYVDEDVAVDGKLLIQWTTSVQALLERVFGRDNSTYENFERYDKAKVNNNVVLFEALHSTFLSAKEQYEGGFLFELKNLAHADLFSDELEQSEHFLSEGYKAPAAVIAGVVLETTLRGLCEQHELSAYSEKGCPKKANQMVSDLAKKSSFSNMTADQLRAWLKIRNSAAHGLPEEFEECDVERMIGGIRDFVASQLG